MTRLPKIERKVEYLSCIGEVKATNDVRGIVEGYLNRTSVIDFGDDRSMPGCFKRTIADSYARKAQQQLDFLFPYLWNHSYDILPPGGIFEADEDKKGLYIKTQFNLDIQLGREIYSSFRAGTLKKQSMGYRAIKYEFVKEDGRSIRNLLEVAVVEGSAVTFPMCDLAIVDVVKSASSERSRPFVLPVDFEVGYKRYQDLLAKHGHHDQRTHGNRFRSNPGGQPILSHLGGGKPGHNVGDHVVHKPSSGTIHDDGGKPVAKPSKPGSGGGSSDSGTADKPSSHEAEKPKKPASENKPHETEKPKEPAKPAKPEGENKPSESAPKKPEKEPAASAEKPKPEKQPEPAKEEAFKDAFAGKSDAAREKFLEENGAKEWTNGLSKTEHAAIQDYTNAGYKTMNAKLRSGGKETKQIKDVQTALLKSKAPADMVVSRGYGNGAHLEAFKAAAKNGGTYTEKGFTSTTIQKKATYQGFSVNVHVKKGAPGAYVEGMSAFKGEKEFLIPHGAKFKVLKGKQDKRGNWTFDVEYDGSDLPKALLMLLLTKAAAVTDESDEEDEEGQEMSDKFVSLGKDDIEWQDDGQKPEDEEDNDKNKKGQEGRRVNRKDFTATYQERQQHDWLDDLWQLYATLTAEIVAAFQMGDSPVEDIKAALNQFNDAMLAYVQRGVDLNMSECLQPNDDSHAPYYGYMSDPEASEMEIKEGRTFSTANHAMMTKAVSGIMEHCKSMNTLLQSAQPQKSLGAEDTLPQQTREEAPQDDAVSTHLQEMLTSIQLANIGRQLKFK